MAVYFFLGGSFVLLLLFYGYVSVFNISFWPFPVPRLPVVPQKRVNCYPVHLITPSPRLPAVEYRPENDFVNLTYKKDTVRITTMHFQKLVSGAMIMMKPEIREWCYGDCWEIFCDASVIIMRPEVCKWCIKLSRLVSGASVILMKPELVIGARSGPVIMVPGNVE